MEKHKKLKIDGKEIPYSSSVKYLGVWFTDTLSWTKHIQERTNKAIKMAYHLKNLVGKNWGLNLERAMWIYTGMIRPMITYASHIWASTSLTQSQIDCLNRLQRLCLGTATRVRKQTPGAALEVICDTMPLPHYCEMVATNTWLRIRDKVKSKWLGLSKYKYRKYGHQRQLTDTLEKTCASLENCQLEKVEKKMIWDDVPIFYTESYNDCKVNELTCYTDGSKTIDDNDKKGKVGFGWVAFTGGSEVATKAEPLGEFSSVPQAELVAMKDVLAWVELHPEYHGKVIRIVSDSKSTLQRLERRVQDSDMYISTKKLAAKLILNGIKLSIHWTKAHVETLGNETADKLAKQGTKMPFLGHTQPRPSLSMTRAYLFLHPRGSLVFRDIKPKPSRGDRP